MRTGPRATATTTTTKLTSSEEPASSVGGQAARWRDGALENAVNMSL